MKKGFMRFIAVFMIVLVAAVFLPASGIDSVMNIEASAGVVGGVAWTDVSLGGKVKWKYDAKNDIITVFGSGNMNNFANGDDGQHWDAIWGGSTECPINRATKIVIENGITNIGNNAFVGFKELKEVVIPASVTSIGAGAFRDNAKLTTVTIPSSVKTIGDGAFRGCTALKSVTIPAAVTTISNNTFYGCSSLSSVNIHDKITSIGANAFNGTNVTSVNMPRSVKTIGSNAFGTVKITCNYGDPGYAYCQSHSNATAVLRTPELKINITPSDNGTIIASFYVKNASGLNAANFTIRHNADIMPVSKEIVVSENSTSMSAVAFGEDNTVSIGVVDVREIPFSACTGECEYKVAEIEFGFADSKHTAEFEFSSSVFMLNNKRYTVPAATATFGEHIYEKSVVAPTCTAKGYTTYTCICGDTYNADETAMIPHPYTSEVTTVATCNSTGVRKFTCTACGDTYEETIAVDTANHVGGTELRDVATEDCGINGYTGDTYCLGCNTKIAEGTVIPATGKHSYIGVETTAATCNANGVMTYTCEVCFNTYDETIAIDADNHAGGTEIRDAETGNCGKAGYTGDTYCLGCNTKLSDGTVIPATGEHGYVGVETTVATCNATGIMTYTCEVCFDSYEETIAIDADNHAGGTEIRDAVSGNCGDAGYTGDTYCLGCDTMIEKGTEIAPDENHEYTSEVTTPATCTATGIETFTCTVCGNKYEEIIAVDGTNHTGGTEIRDAETEDCGNDGYTGDTYCLGCNTKIADGTVIPATGKHNYESKVTTTATCNAEGVKTFTCTVCGDTYDEAIPVDSTNHAGGTEVRDAVDATCGADGYTGDTYCLGCNVKIADGAVIPATGHIPEIIPGKYATENETGLTDGEKCSVCGEILKAQEEIPALGENHVHDYTAFVTYPTCTTGGYTAYRCLACGDTYIADEKEPFGHATVKVPGKLPTETEAGLTEGEVCAVCGEILKMQEEIPALGVEHKHDHIAVVTVPTCTEKGYTTYTCVCGDTYVSDETDLIAHEYKESIVKEATCKENGEKSFRCKTCGKTYTEVIEKLSHREEIIPAVAPTCTQTGLTEGKKCTVCGEITVAQTVVDATGHSYDEGVVTAPTCTTKGFTTYTCTACKNAYTDKETDVIAHDYVETVNKPATCTAEGEKSIICSMCNDTKTEKIPAEGHTFDKGTVTAPTCTAQGYTTYRCTKCDYPEKRDVKAALGHNYGADGKCTRCGATDNSKPAELEFKDNTIFKQNVTDKTVLAMNSGTVAQVKQAMMNSGWEITDANGNKLADDKDLTTGCLLRSADGKQVYAYAILGDVNMDGKVTAADARVALRISAKLDTGTAVMLLAADCDGKERVTAADARIILRVSAKLQSF